MQEKFSGAQLRGGYLRFRPQFVEKIPIRHIKFVASNDSRSRFELQFKSLVNKRDTSMSLAFVEARLNATPEEADIIHDLLAYVAQQMIDLNKLKQIETKRFLGWLEGMLKVSIDEMTGKSKLRHYIGDYQKGESEVSQEELEDILYKNRSKLRISLSDARPMAKIRDEYEKSLAVLRPLKSRLAWTDSLIDQIVYRLYGLTDEEIRIVEGKS